MTIFDFDTPINRRGTNAIKVDIFDDPDILSMWVADMDFAAPESVAAALSERLAHPVFGYTMDDPALRQIIVARLARLYGWAITPQDIVFLPGVVAGFNVAMRAVSESGDKVLMQPPVYPPFLSSPAHNGLEAKFAPLTETVQDGILHYSVDLQAFKDAIDDKTKLFLLCSPHNPTGRVWTEDELCGMAEACMEQGVVICSDEIHADLVFQPHKPLAALSPEIAQNTITLMAPSKTFNIPSLGFSFAVIQNAELRRKFQQAEAMVVPHVGVLGYTAARGAYSGGQAWLDAVLDYLRENRDLTTAYFRENLPQIPLTHPEGTYLSWLDCRVLPPVEETDSHGFSAMIEPFFLQNAKVALNNGKLFGAEGEGYARLNFALPRSQLLVALDRMREAVLRALG